MKEPAIAQCELDFIRTAIKSKLRLDQRNPCEFRKWSANKHPDSGAIAVKLGNTEVHALAKCEVIVPTNVRQSEGTLSFSVDIASAIEQDIVSGNKSDLQIRLVRILERLFRDSRAIDLESLCIVAGKKVFAINVFIHLMNYDGNPIDCASLATTLALKSCRRPCFNVDGEEITIFTPDLKPYVPLNILKVPYTFSFFFVESDEIYLDPTHYEERVMDSLLIVGVTIHYELLVLNMSGVLALQLSQINKCCNLAFKQLNYLSEMLDKFANDLI